MDRRYQVFVSSTYADLQEERQEVMQALLELDCIPSGMELFPAANEDQWTLIKKVIDDCDYYIVIVAGRYGSLGRDGLSYTEMEYRYALEQKKPVIGFVHKDPGSLPAKRCEQANEGKEKLQEFVGLVKQKVCRLWDSPADLGGQVSRSLIKLIKSEPAIGWVRADLVPDASAAEEILHLRKQVEELEATLAAAREQAPEGTSSLAQGTDKYAISFQYDGTHPSTYKTVTYRDSIELTWDLIFGSISPLLIDEATEYGIRKGLNSLIVTLARPQVEAKFPALRLKGFEILTDDFQTIKVQLRALGLITRSTRVRSVKDSGTYWTLTPYGDSVMTRLRAIQRDTE